MAEAVADQSTLDKFRNSVRDFKARYAELSSNAYGARIARTGDNALMLEYGETLARMKRVNDSIDYVLNAYQAAKQYVGLGAIPLIPLAVIAGITITVTAALKTIDSFMLRAGVAQLQKENPQLSTAEATARYRAQTRGTVGETLDTIQMAIGFGVLVLAFLWLRR